MFCPACGQEVMEDANFCPNCGHTFRDETQPPALTVMEARRLAAVHYAGFWRRVLAYLIDVLLVFIVSTGAAAIAELALGVKLGITWGMAGGIRQGPSGVTIFLVRLIIAWLYWAGMESSDQQATLGKMAIGIKVTDLEGERISFGRATGRYFGKIISGLILCIGFMMAGWTAKKQALHDLMAGTLVVKKQD